MIIDACRATVGRRAKVFLLFVLTTAGTSACGSSGDSGREGGAGATGSGGPTTSGSSASGDTTTGSGTTGASSSTVTTGAGGASTTGSASNSVGGATTTTSAGGATTTSAGAGGATATTDASVTTTMGSGGSGGNTSGLNGGASGAFICPVGMTYGDPLEGMGTVEEIMPAQGDFFAFIEGPIWVGSLATLFFSDHSSPRRIFKLVPPSTTPEVWSADSASNGIALDNDDQLIVAEEQRQRITRIDPQSSDPTSVDDANVLVTGYAPNDVIYRSDGNIYFTDPSTGFYRMEPGSTVTGPMTDVQGPNGIVLSPDENTLYVGSVSGQQVWSFPLEGDGGIGSGAKLTDTQNGTVDGMAVDCAGNIYAGTSNGVEVFTAAGDSIGIVPTGESSNVTFGGAERRTLYVTSRAILKAVTLAVPGLPD